MVKYIYLLFFVVFPFFASANFSISPMNQVISSKDKTVSYTLENLSEQTRGYEIKVMTRTINREGNEIRGETNEIRVFPSKIILKPGQKKRIKAMYLGKRNILDEKAFRVIFFQSDLDVTEESNQGINTKYEFITALYVTPDDAEAKISQNVISKNGKEWLVLKNEGSKHKVLKSWTLDLVDSESNKFKYDHFLPNMNLLSKTEVYIELKINNQIGIKNAIINY